MDKQEKPRYDYMDVNGLKGEGKVHLRYAYNQTVIVHCDHMYGKRSILKVPKKIEIREGGRWLPYPVALITPFQTKVLGRNSNLWKIMVSPEGKPDTQLVKDLRDQEILVENL